MEKLHKTIGLLVFYECVYVGNANRYNLTVACVTRIISFYVRFPAVRENNAGGSLLLIVKKCERGNLSQLAFKCDSVGRRAATRRTV